jgi:hypothetical protein
MSQAFYDDPESLLPEPSAYQPATTVDLDQRQGQYQEYIDEHGLTGAGVPQADDGEEERERLEGLKMALEQVPDEVKKVSERKCNGQGNTAVGAGWSGKVGRSDGQRGVDVTGECWEVCLCCNHRIYPALFYPKAMTRLPWQPSHVDGSPPARHIPLRFLPITELSD